MLITDSRGLFDALTRSESPQLRLLSSRTGEEARGITEQCAVSDARIHWVNTSTMLADSLTKPGYPARAVMESFLVMKYWRCTFDPTFESGKRHKARGASLFNDEEVNDVNPLTDPIAFDTLLQDESLSEDVREIMRMNTDDFGVSLPEWSKIEEEFWGMQDMNTRLLSASLDFDVDFNTSPVVYLTSISTLQSFTLIMFFPESCSHVWSAQRTFHVAHSCDECPRFPWSICCLVNSAGIPSTVFILLDPAETLVSLVSGEHARASEWP